LALDTETKMKRLLAVVALLPALWANNSQATVIVSLDSVVDEGGGVFDWVYRASLQPDQTLRTNDFFTIYDFGNYSARFFGAGSGLNSSDFVVSTQATGVTPTGATPPDTGLPNFTVTYTGANIVPDATGGEVTLGNLIVKSSTDQGVLHPFTALSQKTGGAEIVNGGFVQTPVPEPSSIALLIAGLVATGGLAFRRRRSVS
jgi:hypothetical protein